ncbi:DUF3108 domain-containing protein [Deltaproteobacteria bacterium TL4]
MDSLFSITTLILLITSSCLTFAAPSMPSETCALPDSPDPEIPFEAVYEQVPFKTGENATYQVRYSGIFAGYVILKVKKPVLEQGVWQRIFLGTVKSGKWYEPIFAVNDFMEAVSNPFDFRITKFQMEQYEKGFLGKPFIEKKWIVFDHQNCKVYETVNKKDGKVKKYEFNLSYGANDALGMLFYLRTLSYTVGEKARTLVYTSEKNWWLEALPLAEEQIEVPAGVYDTHKIKLTTYLGKQLQQKGEVLLWIAKNKNRPLVQVQAEVKVGTIWLELEKYQPGALVPEKQN